MTDSPVCWTRSEMGSGGSITASGPSKRTSKGSDAFVLHYNKRHPRDMGAAEVEAFPPHVAAAKRVSFFLGP